MMRRTAVLLLLSSALAAAEAVAASDGPPLTRHVIVVSIDGLRPDAIASAEARTLGRLLAEGSGTLLAQTVVPSLTLPSHVSMLTGTLPGTHGITWNRDRTGEVGTVATPTVFELARAAGYHTAAFFSKGKLRHLVRPGSLDRARAPRGGVLPASRTVEEAARYLARERPNLLFVHIAEPDVAGHALGWMSAPYRWAVREADAAVGALLDAAAKTFGEDGFILIVTADHGGTGRGHGSAGALDTTIPWISWGRGIRRGHTLEAPVRTVDTAATVLHALAVPVPATWDGVPVLEAFGGA